MRRRRETWIGWGSGEEREAGDVRVWVGNMSQQSQIRSGGFRQVAGGGWQAEWVTDGFFYLLSMAELLGSTHPFLKPPLTSPVCSELLAQEFPPLPRHFTHSSPLSPSPSLLDRERSEGCSLACPDTEHLFLTPNGVMWSGTVGTLWSEPRPRASERGTISENPGHVVKTCLRRPVHQVNGV